MKEKGKIARVFAFGVKIAGPKTWLFSLVKENLGPKIGTGVAVYQVAKIILDSMVKANTQAPHVSLSDAAVTIEQAESLVSMLDVVNSWQLAVSLIGFSALWFFALVVRGCFKFCKIKSRKLFKFGQLGPYFGAVAQFLMGMLLVPLVLTGAIVALVPEAFTLEQGAYFWFVAASFLIVVIAMHYFAFIEKELTNSVIYTIETPKTMALPVSTKVVEEFSIALEGLDWIGSPDTFSESSDGRLVVAIPILYNADHWSSDEAKQLGARLQIAESALIGIGCKILSRTDPKKIQKQLPVAMRKPLTASIAKVPSTN
jgi:hypothetical protein